MLHLVVFFLSFLLNEINGDATTTKPNILYIMTDDMGWYDVSFNHLETGKDPDGDIISDTSCRDKGNYITPGIDQLASDGLKLTNFYTNPACTPTRLSFLTGRYAFEVGSQAVYQVFEPTTMDPNQPTIAELMTDGGYDTVHVGKWHAGFASWSNTPFSRGFNHALSYMYGTHNYYSHALCVGLSAFGLTSTYQTQFQSLINPEDPESVTCLDAYDLLKNNKVAKPENYRGEYATETWVKRVLDYFEEREDICTTHKINENNTENGSSENENHDCKPFFMWWSDNTPHFPLENPPIKNLYGDNLETKYNERCSNIGDGAVVHDNYRIMYCKLMTYLDDAIYNIVRPKLIEYDLWDSTLIIFSSDNGAQVGIAAAGGGGAAYAQSIPLRGVKGSTFEGGIRVPAFISGGWLFANYPHLAGQSYSGAMFIGDLLPTFLNMIGESSLIPSNIDGINQWDNIKTLNNTYDAINNRIISYLQWDINNSSTAARFASSYIREGKYKLLVNGAAGRNLYHDYTGSAISSCIWGNKYISPYPTSLTDINTRKNNNHVMLFNIEQDPYERYNLLDPIIINNVNHSRYDANALSIRDTLYTKIVTLKNGRLAYDPSLRSNGAKASAMSNYVHEDETDLSPIDYYFISQPWKDNTFYASIDDGTVNWNADTFFVEHIYEQYANN